MIASWCILRQPASTNTVHPQRRITFSMAIFTAWLISDVVYAEMTSMVNDKALDYATIRPCPVVEPSKWFRALKASGDSPRIKLTVWETLIFAGPCKALHNFNWTLQLPRVCHSPRSRCSATNEIILPALLILLWVKRKRENSPAFNTLQDSDHFIEIWEWLVSPNLSYPSSPRALVLELNHIS